MRHFDIKKPDNAIAQALSDKIDDLTKPKGALGRLEELALQVGLVQQTTEPRLTAPHNILFAADHGVMAEGVSVSPKEVTLQQLVHFAHGGAGINFLCDQHGFRLVLVDAGVDADVPYEEGILDYKVARGTRNFRHEPAMTVEQWNRCIDAGAEVVDMVADSTGCNIVSFGEMGSGNTSPSSMWMHILTGLPMAQCVGAGAGLDTPGIRHKLEVLTDAMAEAPADEDTLSRLIRFGGFELAMAVGGMLRAAERGMLILVDGFIMTACMAAAAFVSPEIRDYAIYGHQGDEPGHRLLLDYLGAKPLLHLSLRLGEGSGAVCAYPIVESAVRMINEMDRFHRVGVTRYFD